MSDSKKSANPVVSPIPENMPEELLPLYDWWQANGRQAVVGVVIVAVLATGITAWKHWHTSNTTKANQELLKATSVDELESAVAQYGSTRAGNAARVRLAKSFFDSAKYEDAFNTYDACLSKGAPQGFKEVVELGRAHSLEALNRLDEAMSAYQQFEKSHAEHFLLPKAIMGQARVLTLQGNKEEALRLLENLKARKTGATAWEMEITNLEGIVKRYVPRAVRSLFDAADAAMQTITTPQAEAVAPEASPAPITP